MNDHALREPERTAIRLFRRWTIAREGEINPVAALFALTNSLGCPVETAPACASLFELVEGHLGRSLRRECCCSNTCSSDELALIGLLRCAPDLGGTAATCAIPHGLPGAVCWAAMAVRRALGMLRGRVAGVEACPFNLGSKSIAV